MSESIERAVPFAAYSVSELSAVELSSSVEAPSTVELLLMAGSLLQSIVHSAGVAVLYKKRTKAPDEITFTKNLVDEMTHELFVAL